jgi:hypothetical protein
MPTIVVEDWPESVRFRLFLDQTQTHFMLTRSPASALALTQQPIRCLKSLSADRRAHLCYRVLSQFCLPSTPKPIIVSCPRWPSLLLSASRCNALALILSDPRKPLRTHAAAAAALDSMMLSREPPPSLQPASLPSPSDSQTSSQELRSTRVIRAAPAREESACLIGSSQPSFRHPARLG